MCNSPGYGVGMGQGATPGAILALLIAEKGLTQAGLADAAGTTRQQVYKLIRGETKMSRDWAQRLAPHLGVHWGVLLGMAPDEIAPASICLSGR